MAVSITVHLLDEDSTTFILGASNMREAQERCKTIFYEGAGYTTTDGVFLYFPGHMIAYLEVQEY